MLQSGLARAERAAPVPMTSRTDRIMARVALVIVAGGLVYGFYSLGGPIYWKFYATVIHPYQDAVHPPSPVVTPGGDPVGGGVAAKVDVQPVKVEPIPVKVDPVPAKVDPVPVKVDPVPVKVDPVPVKVDPVPVKVDPVPAKVEPVPVKVDPVPVKVDPVPVKVDPVPVKVDPVPVKVDPVPVKVDPVPVVTPDTKTGTFDPDAHQLTRERVQGLLQDGLIMMTWANHHYLDFAKSWVYNLRKAGVGGFMVGAMDDDMLKDLVLLNIPTWRMNTGITKKDLGWGSQNFHLMGRFKIKLIRDVLALDVTVVVSDIDTAWVKNPIPYFHRYPDADILTSTDQLSPTVQDDSLENFPQAGSSFNIGIMLFRPRSKDFVDEWVKTLDDPKMWDQTAFNELAREGHKMSEPPRNLWLGYRGKLKLGVLPCALFASGHTFFVQHKYAELGLEPYVAHATFQYSGTPGKRNRFREAMLFDDPPEYYNDHNGFVTIDMDIPQALLDAAAKPVIGAMTADKLGDHFALVHHQLFRLRAAIAVALITDRIIVLPRIWCQLDKYWAPLDDGNIPGTHWKKPFICPADHVLDLEGGWYHVRQEFGAHLEYREYSFFENPRMTKAVNDSRVTVQICKPGESDCATGDAPAPVKDGVVRLAPQLSSNQIAKALEGIRGSKIIVMQNAADAFKEFSNQEDQLRFVNRLNHYASVFCCLQAQPGWIWYDFFADRPHSDRFSRKFETWVPKHGDSNKDVDGYKAPVPVGSRRRSLLEQVAEAVWGGEQDAVVVVRQRPQRDQGVVRLVGGSGQQMGLPRRLQSEEGKIMQDFEEEINAMYGSH